MILDGDSPFRQIPVELNQSQATFLDGIRYSVDMAELAYERLRVSLYGFAIESHSSSESSPESKQLAAIFLDAWSIIDSVHRLRGILDQMPGLSKGKSPKYQLFRRKTQEVEEFRHTVQHLNHELREMAKNGWPVWGVLDWVTAIDSKGGVFRSSMIVSGRCLSGEHPICNPLGKDIELPVDHVTLHLKDLALSLSDTMRSVRAVVLPIEKTLRKQFKGLSASGADIFVHMDVEIDS